MSLREHCEETMEGDMELDCDFMSKTLNWAACQSPAKPSRRVEFLEKYFALCTQEELKRISKLSKNIRRKNFCEASKPRNDIDSVSKLKNADGAECPSKDADCPLDAKISSPEPWWTKYAEDQVCAIDCEMVTLLPQYSPTNSFFQEAATVDIVDSKYKQIYSTKVQHPPGTFKADKFLKALTGFEASTFAYPAYPRIENVRDQVSKILSKKLVITIGGQCDFSSLGLDMADFDYFDLQSHFFVKKINEHGISVREGHSLRSLSANYPNSQQKNQHSSFEDAKSTMELFEICKKIKIQDDLQNSDKRYNDSLDYNHIPVIPNPLKNMFKKKRH